MMRRLYRLLNWSAAMELLSQYEEERAKADYERWIEAAKRRQELGYDAAREVRSSLYDSERRSYREMAKHEPGVE